MADVTSAEPASGGEDRGLVASGGVAAQAADPGLALDPGPALDTDDVEGGARQMATAMAAVPQGGVATLDGAGAAIPSPGDVQGATQATRRSPIVAGGGAAGTDAAGLPLGRVEGGVLTEGSAPIVFGGGASGEPLGAAGQLGGAGSQGAEPLTAGGGGLSALQDTPTEPPAPVAAGATEAESPIVPGGGALGPEGFSTPPPGRPYS
jgi:hypothetical protein